MLTGYFQVALVQKGEDGKDGKSPTVWKIVPSISSLNYSYNSGNTLVGSHTFSVKVIEQHGETTVQHTSEPGPIYTYIGYDNSVSRDENGNAYNGITVSASSAASHSNYTIEIWAGQKGYGGTLADKVTIPIVKGGTNGTDGGRGPMGAKPRTREWKPDTYYMQGLSTEEWYDMVEYEGYMYLCLNSHWSSASYPPPQSSNWRREFSQPFITTSTLRAQRIYADQIDGNGLSAVNADISGKITATEGQIGNFSIINNNLSVSSGSYYTELYNGGLKTDNGSTYATLQGGTLFLSSKYITTLKSCVTLNKDGLDLYGEAVISNFKTRVWHSYYNQGSMSDCLLPYYNVLIFYSNTKIPPNGINLSKREQIGYNLFIKNFNSNTIMLIGQIVPLNNGRAGNYELRNNQSVHLIFCGDYWYEF